MSASLRDLLHEVFAPLGTVTIRAMFGGGGVYVDGVIFGLIIEDTLYLKADSDSIALFEAEGMAAFSYATSSGRTTINSYWRAPERLFDEPDEMRAWARRALETSRRSQAKNPPRRRAAAKSNSRSIPTTKPSRPV